MGTLSGASLFPPEAVEECNELDLELYRYAKKLFEEQIRRCGYSFAMELGAFRLVNRAYGIVQSLKKVPT